MLTLTSEEKRLLKCLTDDWWSKHGLKGVRVVRSTMTNAGVVADIELIGLSREKLENSLDQVRLILDAEDDHPVVILSGGRARRARIAVRSRRVTEEMDMLWHPGRKGLGVDSVTGKTVDIPFTSQLQVSGAKGSGKSWAMRPLMAKAVLMPEISPVFADPKIVEGTIWQGLMPVHFPDTFEDMLDEAEKDMEDRAETMRKEKSSVWRPEFGPYKLYIVDEGREMLGTVNRIDTMNKKIQAMRSRGGDEGAPDLSPKERDCLGKLLMISSMGRAWGVFLWWATQYPIVSTKNPGIDTNIDANCDYRFSLRVSKPAHAAVSLGEDADYGPHLLTADPRNRGFGYLGGHGPSLIQTWTVTDEMLGLLSHPDNGRGKYPRDVALNALRKQPDALWTPSLLTSHTGCGTTQAARFLRSFTDEGLMESRGDAFRLTA